MLFIYFFLLSLAFGEGQTDQGTTCTATGTKTTVGTDNNEVTTEATFTCTLVQGQDGSEQDGSEQEQEEYYTMTISGDGELETVQIDTPLVTKDLIKKLVLGEGITHIKTNSNNYGIFSEYSLTSVEFPTTLEAIEKNAFTGNLFTTLTFKSSVDLGQYSFSRCEALTTVTFEATPSNIHKQAFSYCSAISSYSITPNDGYFTTKGGALCAKFGTVLAAFPPAKKFGSDGKLVLGEGDYSGIKVIYDNSFNGNTNLKHLEIKGGVTSLRANAFQGCSNLETVTLNSAINSVSEGVFKSCTKLTTVTIGNDVKLIGNSMFSGCTALKTVTIGSGVLTIEQYAFMSDATIGEIVIPDSCRYIRDNAFFGCGSIKKLTIGKGVRSISASAFLGCSQLTDITIDEENTIMYRIDSSSFSKAQITSLTIPPSVEIIGDQAFSETTRLQTVTFRGKDQPAYCSPIAFEGSTITNGGIQVLKSYPQQEFCGIRVTLGLVEEDSKDNDKNDNSNGKDNDSSDSSSSSSSMTIFMVIIALVAFVL